jgi:hypothetical protein
MAGRTRHFGCFAVVLACASSSNAGTISGCGTVVQGVECNLFQFDSGGTFVVNLPLGAQVGDRFLISGNIIPDCITFCQQGDGCVVVEFISDCPANQFNSCGTIIQGVECPLFAADAGGTYILDTIGSFQIGDRVRVTGSLDPLCVSFCQQGDGCIRNNTITACDNGAFDSCGILILSPECILFASDTGGEFVVDNLGSFQVGDRVRVTGTLEPLMATFCFEGDARITNNTITICRGSGSFLNTCGTVVQDVECLLFEADAGGLYIVDFPPGTQVGDRLRVTGRINPICASFCFTGQCVEPCGPGALGLCQADFNRQGGLNVQDIFDFLAAWNAADRRADYNIDAAITVQDIFDFLAAWNTGCQ